MKFRTIKKVTAGIVLSLTLGFSATTEATNFANGVDDSVSISADGGSFGAGIHFSFPLHDNINFRVGASGYTTTYNESTNDADYDFKLKLRTIEALLDWYPNSGGFHLSAGLFHNGNKISTAAKPSDNNTFTINSHTYTSAETGNIDGTIQFKSVAPYLGLGWDSNTSKQKGWGFTSDLGVIFQGSPTSNLGTSRCLASALVCAQLINDLSDENLKLEQKANNYKTYPVLRIGVSYSF